MKKRIIIILVIIIAIYIAYRLNPRNITSFYSYRPYHNNFYEKNDIEKINKELPKVDAASSFYPLTAALIQYIYDEESYNNELEMVATSKAYEDLLNSKVDFIIATSPSDDQKNMIESCGKKLKFIPIAKEALIFYINKNNSINSLSIEDIKKIYTKQISNWEELGGIKGEINTYQLEKNNGSQTCFESIVKDNKVDNINYYEIDNMRKIIYMTANNKNGIGYAFNSFYTKIYNNSKLKLVNINSIEPSFENIVSGKYPLMYDVYFIYDENNNNTNILKVLDWILSDKGQKIVENMGFKSI